MFFIICNYVFTSSFYRLLNKFLLILQTNKKANAFTAENLKMKRYILSVASVCFFLSCAFAANDIKLPKVSIAGEEYYVYQVKKGDSLYGISNRYGWDVDRLASLNPSQSLHLEKGAKIYFPVNDKPKAVDARNHEFVLPETYPMIRHIVKKGDSVYSIAKIYGVPVDVVYTYNPETKGGLKRGSVVNIPQNAKPINDGVSFYYYSIRPGDTLNGIAETYNTSVEDLMRDNKGLSEYKFKVSDVIRVRVNSNKGKLITETVEETHVDHLESVKATKDDSWQSISDKTGVEVEELLEANAGTKLKKNASIVVPVMVTSQVEKEVEFSDDREGSAEGRHEIYNQVHAIEDTDSISGFYSPVNVAVIIEDPKSKRDNEFTRGVFLALDELKESPFRINLKVIHDDKAASDSVSVTQRIVSDLDGFNPDLIVATYEKNFPVWLAKYGDDNATEIVNAFDVKNELYLDNPSIIHLLTPSPYFTEEVAEWTASSFGNYQIVLVGKEDPEDAFATAIVERVGGKSPICIQIEALAEMNLDEGGAYLFYGYPTGRDDVSSMLTAISDLAEKCPLARIKVMGRPNWITFSDGLKEQFAKADVYFPSRFFFDHAGKAGKEFIADYSAAYGHGPIRSFPTYAAAGYDIINYFIPGLASNSGDFNVPVSDGNELQTPISLERVGNWGGFFNPSAYIIHYNTYGDVEKILISK